MYKAWPDHFNSRRACDLVFSHPVCLLCLYEAQAGRLVLAVGEEGQWQSQSAALGRSVQLLYREGLVEPQRDYFAVGKAGYALTVAGRWLLSVLLDFGWTPERVECPPALTITDALQAGSTVAYAASFRAEIMVLRKVLRTRAMADCLLACPIKGRFTLPMLGEDIESVGVDAAHLRHVLLFFTRSSILQRYRLIKRHNYCYELTNYGISIQHFFRCLFEEKDFQDRD